MVQRTLRQGTETLRDETYLYDTSGRLGQYQCTGTQRPVDPYGRTLRAQAFTFDGANNLTVVTTRFNDGSDDNSNVESNNARYFYEGDDPVQLSRVTNSNDKYYPSEIKLEYDLDGNLKTDEAGRTLKYDPLGRLIEVGTPSAGIHYQYDPQDQLTGETRGDDRDLRFYSDAGLANQLGSHVQSTFMRGDDYLLAEQQSDHTLLLATDGSDSVLGEVGGDGINRRRYTAYGHASGEAPPLGKLGFNGELAEADSGWQMLGNGYRAYSPVLMRFNSPDSWSPFGKGGVNGYAYVEGDPVNRVDPSGHFGIFTPFKLLYRALKQTPTLTTKSPGVEQIPELLTTRGSKAVTKLSNIKLTDWDRLKEVVDSYPKRIADARNNFMPKLADSLALKQFKAQESLNYMVGNFGEPGITAHARRTIAKELSLAKKELKKIPSVENIRNPKLAPEKVGLDRYLPGKPKDRYSFD
ncbi:YD repeat-containing protein [Pseudomonas amygdali pv. tabaci]|uniref:YD repeat-containing protein n=2 Tax=Pseudomonas amygdali TaxID=47877 RepID=A0A3M6GZ43_PSEAJ|nr:YD repeat-containing protein [Pseudomonas amygdali pv. tabaci]